MTEQKFVGYFRGRKTIQRSGTIGGARSVFVKLQGNKNELVYPTFGGLIKNPFKGAAKIFAGDLLEYRTDADGVNPEIYVLKTYKVVGAASTTTFNLLRSGYLHTPFVGDKIGVAPAAIGGAITTVVTITSVEKSVVGGVDVWKITADKALTADDGAVLVEADSAGKMLVKNINAVTPVDCDMFDAPAVDDNDFDGARYTLTPALGGIMYTNKMSPMPACVLALNQSKVNGWFQIQSV